MTLKRLLALPLCATGHDPAPSLPYCYLCLRNLGSYSLRQLLCLCGLCRPWAIKYAEDEKLFFGDYAKAQVKLSELGSKWAPGAPYVLDI